MCREENHFHIQQLSNQIIRLVFSPQTQDREIHVTEQVSINQCHKKNKIEKSSLDFWFTQHNNPDLDCHIHHNALNSFPSELL